MEFWRTAQVMEARVIDAYAKAGSCPEEDELLLTNYLEGKRVSLGACGAPSLKRDLVEHLAAKHMLTLPLKLAVGNRKDKRNSDIAKVHAVESLKNVDEFIFIDSSLAVASPALCICIKAGAIDSISLAQTISHSLSSYVLDTWTGNSILRARPLTQKNNIAFCAHSFLGTNSTRQIGEGKKVIALLDYIAANSYSPRESALQLLFCLPRSLGGYELPLPLLNSKQHLSSRSTLKPDLYWESAGIAVEYNGEQYHSSPQQIENDRLRRAAFESHGIKVIEVDRHLLGNVVATRRIATEISAALGKRLRTEGKRFAENHAILRSRLLSNPWL